MDKNLIIKSICMPTKHTNTQFIFISHMIICAESWQDYSIEQYEIKKKCLSSV